MPCNSSGEALTRQFYEWEMRGRGWQVWDRPVALEPPFRPFFGHFVPGTPGAVADDGRKPTFLSNLVDGFSKRRGYAGGLSPLRTTVEPAPTYMEDRTALVEVQAVLPPETKITKDAAGQFLMSLGDVSRPASFEIIGTSDSILVQLASAPRDHRQMREQLQAYFPEALLSERKGYLEALWDQTGARVPPSSNTGSRKSSCDRCAVSSASIPIPWRDSSARWRNWARPTRRSFRCSLPRCATPGRRASCGR